MKGLDWRLLVLVAAVSLASSYARVSDEYRAEAFIGYSEKGRVPADASTLAAVELTSEYGSVIIKLRRDLAPNTCRMIAAHALTRTCAHNTCRFYRHEPIIAGWGVGGQYGPPYGLLQGNIGLPDTPQVENPAKAATRLWQVSMIGSSSNFFIATVDHAEWGAAFTVWGEVLERSHQAVLAHPTEPYRNSTDSGNITTRWLLKDIPFTIKPVLGL